uniref:Uncharacterized protein n=1 Tax=Podoviridae sp. ctz6O13 TaxID=2827757 RepID=A0A8S5TLL8_9CAUD|nr:MAG TPA: hypothetical protein [Podoviridae sp. ctz6O13]
MSHKKVKSKMDLIHRKLPAYIIHRQQKNLF